MWDLSFLLFKELHKLSLSDKIITVKPVLAAVEMWYTLDAQKEKRHWSGGTYVFTGGEREGQEVVINFDLKINF